MFSDEITESDAFVDMPTESQLLYFHLGMKADDDGFIGNIKVVQRVIGASDDSVKILFAKKFLIPFESGVCVIKHWRINNSLRKEIYQETKYIKEKKMLFIRKNGAYSLNPNDALLLPEGHFTLKNIDDNNVGITSTERRQNVDVGKVRKGKVSIDIELPNWLDKKVWNDWVTYRKEIGKSLKQSTVRLQLVLLEKHQKDHIQIIKNSITNGWTGLFEIKPMTKGGNSDYARAYDKKIQQDREELERRENEKENDRFRKISEQSRALANKFDPNK